jgi:hypothetical protein
MRRVSRWMTEISLNNYFQRLCFTNSDAYVFFLKWDAELPRFSERRLPVGFIGRPRNPVRDNVHREGEGVQANAPSGVLSILLRQIHTPPGWT